MLSQNTLQQAIALYQAGKLAEARALLAQLARQEPDNENVWLWLAACTDHASEKKYCLEQVLRINPGNLQARQALNAAGTPPIPVAPPRPPVRPPQPAPAPYVNPAPATTPKKSFWQQIPPDLRASLLFAIFHVISGVINATTGGLAFVLTYPGIIMLALFQGFFVARYIAIDERYSAKDTVSLSAKSGLWTWLLSATLGLIAAIIMVGASMGVLLVLLPVLLVRHLTELLLFVLGSMLGAWLYNKFGGKQLVLYSCLTGCGCSLLFGLLLAGLIALLASLGYQAFQGLKW